MRVFWRRDGEGRAEIGNKVQPAVGRRSAILLEQDSSRHPGRSSGLHARVVIDIEVVTNCSTSHAVSVLYTQHPHRTARLRFTYPH
jgi:hypothetical protein